MTVRPIERSAKIPSLRTGLLAALPRFAPDRSGAPCGRRGLRLGVAGVALVLSVGVGVRQALAALPKVTATKSSRAGRAIHRSYSKGASIRNSRKRIGAMALQPCKVDRTPVVGGDGTITKDEAEKLKFAEYFNVHGELKGLSPEVPYYVLLTATNASGKAEKEATSFKFKVDEEEDTPGWKRSRSTRPP